jgi:hypothetical protein
MRKTVMNTLRFHSSTLPLCARLTGLRFAVAATAILAAAAPTFSQSRFDFDNAFLPPQVWNISTVPSNGDVNPYGVAFVDDSFPVGAGPLVHGDILISNFNNSANLQGTGTTIVDISKNGTQSLFFQGSAPLGLTTALGTLSAGLVVVGNGPTTDGTSGTATAGSLLVINNQGQLIQAITGPAINYPWDMTLVDNGSTAIAFVSNALDGTVNRLNFAVSATGLTLQSWKTIGSGYMHRGDPVALFVAPTGSAYDSRRDILYVASTGDNAVFAIRDAAKRQSGAGAGQLVYQDNVHLHGALGLAWAPNGHLLVTNNDSINPDPNQNSEIVEFTTRGEFVKEISVDPGAGGSFGLAVHSSRSGTIFAAVDDSTSTLFLWKLNNDLF